VRKANADHAGFRGHDAPFPVSTFTISSVSATRRLT
jgi:hypothetical protein